MTILTICNNPIETETNLLVDEITRTWSNPVLKISNTPTGPRTIPLWWWVQNWNRRLYPTVKNRTTLPRLITSRYLSIPDSKNCPKLVFTEGTSWYFALPMRVVVPSVFHPWARCKAPGNCGMILRISNVKCSYARYKSRRVFPECGMTYT